MEKQPYNQPSCGSVFKNPPGDYAARLIEASGLKGKIKGSAQISPKHANFIVNLGKASSNDILFLINTARETVLRNYSIDLMPEVQILQSTEYG
jgi:UDP-N-acetylmuramate dehydrogenase